jgi:ABC-type lipoprotein release transport system permease subunit
MLAVHLGLRYLRTRRTAWLAFGAIVLTVAVPIAVMGVMQGFVEVMRKQVRASEADITVESYLDSPGVADTPAQRDRLRRFPGVAALAPTINGQALMTPRRSGPGAEYRNTVFCQVDGIEWEADLAMGRLPPANQHRTPALDLNQPPLPPERRGTAFLTPTWRASLVVMGGQLMGGLGPLPLPPRPTPTAGAVAGQELAFGLGLSPGDARNPGTRVQLLVPNGLGGSIGKVPVEISDTLGTGIYEVDKYQVLLPLPLARRLFGLDHGDAGAPLVTGYRLQLHDPARSDAVASAVRDDSGLQTSTWMQRRGYLVKGLVQQRNIIGFVMILVQVLAVFIVYAVFSTLVAEKRHDLGVLLGLGARRSEIVNAFLIACGTACVLGGLLGWAIGWGFLAVLNPLCRRFDIALFPQDFFYSPDTPISFDPLVPLFFIGIMTSIGLVAAALPAWRAGRTDPVQILREGA